jgi:hypothetical protein
MPTVFVIPLAHANTQLHPWTLHRVDSGVVRFGAASRGFTSDTNYGPDGAATEVTGLGLIRRTEVAGTLELGLHPRLTLFGTGRWNNTELRSPTLTGNHYGMGDQSLGLSLRLVDSGMALDFQVRADLPAYQNADAQAQGLPFLGDASTDVHVGGFVTLPLIQNDSRQIHFTAGAAYTTRTAGFSAAIPWSLEFSSVPGWSETKGLTASLSAWGSYSLKTDSSGDAVNSGTRFAGGAGSFLVNAVNPSIATLQATTGYRFSPMLEFHAGTAITLWGQASAKGLSWIGGLSWSMDRGGTSRAGGRTSKPRHQFTTYSGEGRVKTVTSTRTLLIDQGSHHGLAVGDRLDVFSINAEGAGDKLVARAEVIQIEAEQAQVSLMELFRETAIKEGFIVRKSVQP